MKAKTKKTPWARYITIGLFMAAFAIVITKQFSRPKAQIGLTYESLDKTVETPGSDGGGAYTNSNKNEKVVLEGRKCKEANAYCAEDVNLTGFLHLADINVKGSPESSGSGNPTTGDEGALRQVGRLFSMVYTPQASGVYYVADAMSSMGLASPTYAQGYGYYALSPFLRLWRVFRNVVYMIFAIMIIVIALLILFRQKSGSQAAVTAQQALPRIVVALILVTFSYAIAGLLIDAMYVCLYMIAQFVNVEAGTLAGSGGTKVTKEMLTGGGFGDLAQIMLAGNFSKVYNSVNDMVKAFMGGDDFWSKIAANITGVVASLIFGIALLFSLFRLLFILMKSYASVLLYTIFSPFFLMMHAIPGTNSFSSWIKKMVANLLPTIIVFVMIVMVGAMNYYTKNSEAGGFIPPYITSSAGTGAGKAAENVGTIVGLAIMLAMPEIVTGIKQKLAGGPGFFEQMAGTAGNRFMQYGGNATMGWLRANTLGRAQRGALWAGNQIKGATAGRALGAWDHLRRYNAARTLVDQEMNGDDTTTDQVARISQDRNILALQENYRNLQGESEEARERLIRNTTDAESEKQTDDALRQFGWTDADFEANRDLSVRRNALVRLRMDETKKQINDAKQKYEDAVSAYASRNNIKLNETPEAVRKAAIAAKMKEGEGSYLYWGTMTAKQGFGAALRTLVNQSDFVSERSRRVEVAERRRAMSTAQMVNAQLGINVTPEQLLQLGNTDRLLQQMIAGQR